jgi:hypothetical protein
VVGGTRARGAGEPGDVRQGEPHGHQARQRDKGKGWARGLSQAHLRAAVVPTVRPVRASDARQEPSSRTCAYYTCEINRRHSGLVPEDHPRMVYLREDKAGEKVVEFLATHLFGPDRIEALRKSLAEVGPEADNAHAEVDRLGAELDGIRKRIRRLVTNLEAQEPDSEIADDIRARLEELAALRAKKQRALEAAEKEREQVPDPESAEALVSALPLLDLDWELVSDKDFRDLHAALNFEATYEPRKRETIRVTLVPELTSPDGDRAPLLFVLLTGHYSNLPDLRFREGNS